MEIGRCERSSRKCLILIGIVALVRMRIDDLIKGDIGRWAYGLTWATVLIMTWHYCPTVNIDRLSNEEEDE